jgi:hypothetical protein
LKITLRWARKSEQEAALEGVTFWLSHWHYRCPGEQQDPLFVRDWRLGVAVEFEFEED